MGKKLKDRRFCKLSAQDVAEDVAAFVALVAEPHYVCLKCWRVSACKDNLCKPKKLEKLAQP